MQETSLPKKRRGPKPTGWGVQVAVRMHDDLLSRVDTLASARGDGTSRADVVRFILKDWFIAQGLMPPEPDDEEDSTAG